MFDFFKKKGKPSEAAEPEDHKTIEEGLEKTRSTMFGKLGKALVGRSTIDATFLDELEEILVAADVGVATTIKIIDRLEERVSKDRYLNTAELNRILKDEISRLMKESNQEHFTEFSVPADKRPYVVLVVGVNGVGKTTTIGKLAYRFQQQGLKVMLGAADTFRAAAVDQLKIWGERVGVPVISRGMGTDPASVAYDAVQSAQSKGADVVIIDTAGRLHNKAALMNELAKVKKVMQKFMAEAPHEVLLVLDASTGQNAIEQAKQFTAVTDVNAIALTKLDGTAKGGVVIGIIDQFKVPVKYIGIGEKMEHLKLFNGQEFVEGLFSGRT